MKIKNTLKILQAAISPQAAGLEYLSLKAQKDKIEARLKELSPELQAFLVQQKNWTLDLEPGKLLLVHSQNRHFKLNEAEKKIEKRILRPFISVTEFDYIRVIFKGLAA